MGCIMEPFCVPIDRVLLYVLKILLSDTNITVEWEPICAVNSYFQIFSHGDSLVYQPDSSVKYQSIIIGEEVSLFNS